METISTEGMLHLLQLGTKWVHPNKTWGCLRAFCIPFSFIVCSVTLGHVAVTDATGQRIYSTLHSSEVLASRRSSLSCCSGIRELLCLHLLHFVYLLQRKVEGLCTLFFLPTGRRPTGLVPASEHNWGVLTSMLTTFIGRVWPVIVKYPIYVYPRSQLALAPNFMYFREIESR